MADRYDQRAAPTRRRADIVPDVVRTGTGDEGQPATMPAVDWLTGLASRAAFVRQVTQADRDRDRFAIAVIRICDFADLNGQLDYDAGDELLRLVGRTLAHRTSVNTTVGRLGGAEFGLLAVDVEQGEVSRLISPVATELRAAIAEWTRGQAEETGVPVVEPGLAVGAAWGCSERVWAEAGTAAEVAGRDGEDPVVVYSADDHRIAALEHRRAIDRDIVAAVSEGRLATVGRRIDVADSGRADWTWRRLTAACRRADGHPTGPTWIETAWIDTSRLSTITGRRVERWLVDRAAAVIGAASGPVRLTVPISNEVAGGQALGRSLFPVIERHRIPPSRLIFEVEEAALVESADGGRRLARQLADIGSSLVVSGCDGGWTTWEIVDRAPIAYLKPAVPLVERAGRADRRAARTLATMTANAEDAGIELIAPASGLGNYVAAQLGFTYVERAELEVVDPNPERAPTA